MTPEKIEEYNDAFGDGVAEECYNLYKSLGKKGKPQMDREWTNMACIVKTDNIKGKSTVEVVTLATGTKCIGENFRTNSGMLLNDSHAEVLARRLFLKYLYQQIKLAIDNPANSIFSHINKMFTLRPAIRFHLFSTDSPCGDASIFPRKFPTDDKIQHCNNRKRKKSEGVVLDDNSKKKKTRVQNNDVKKEETNDFCLLSQNENQIREEENRQKQQQQTEYSVNNTVTNDVHRTGAKCVPGGTQDMLEPGENYHATGTLRIKPGRGDRTLSMSCSDKIMRWCHLGMQGGLLSNLLSAPVYLSTIIVSATECSIDAVKRAVSNRGRIPSLGLLETAASPIILHSKLPFVDCKENVDDRYNVEKVNDGKVTPAGVSILWCGACNIHELTSNGRKHGITKKHINTEKASTSVCKKKLLKDFMDIINLKNCSDVHRKLDESEGQPLTSYRHLKHKNENYKTRRKEFFKLFPEWTLKPVEHEVFHLNTI